MIPTLVSVAALVIAAGAWWHTREKIRLDLFEKRWDVYRSMLKIRGLIVLHGGVPNPQIPSQTDDFETLMAEANKSLKGEGAHLARALFGKEIYDECQRFWSHLAWFQSIGRQTGSEEEWSNRMLAVLEASEKLAELFEPYMYFGKYKDWFPGWQNRAYKYD